MRGTLALLALLALVPVLAGCGGQEDESQRYAREATESYLADDPDYDADEVRCTGNPRPWFVERQTTVVVCAVRRVAGGCDWYRVKLVPKTFRVATEISLEARDAGCVLPT